ncbi:MAG: hypothetical protein QOH73_1023 [Gaiellaceae bacterium]|jgi:hypothetical protein|nr:hypothetical protein [Gaiellaceae bacterium]
MTVLGFQSVIDALKISARALREAEVPFVLGGGMACWARGGPETDHDVDFMIRPQDAERALEALGKLGMRTEHPPEDWLYKAWHDDVLIDLIFAPIGEPLDDHWFANAEEIEVTAVRMKVAALEDVVSTSLLALSEQYLRYESVVMIARALREQIDWDEVRTRTSSSPFAKAFFTLVEELGIVPRARLAPASSAPSAAA